MTCDHARFLMLSNWSSGMEEATLWHNYCIYVMDLVNKSIEGHTIT